MKYSYTPLDIACFFMNLNLSRAEEKEVINALWKSQYDRIWSEYRKDKLYFIKSISHERLTLMGYLDDVDEINSVFIELGSDFQVKEFEYIQGDVESLFKFIKLKLMYIEGTDYYKIKLRNLLKKFGYKRRSVELVNRINEAIKELDLKVNLRGYQPCDIGGVGLDEMIMVRLGSATASI